MFTKRSGGPKTELGKFIVSNNAIKHGAYAVNPVLPGENRADYEALLENCFKVFRPRGLYEENLITNLVDAMWRKARFCALQDRITHNHLNNPPVWMMMGYSYINDPRRMKFAQHIDQFNDEDFEKLADSVGLLIELLDQDHLTATDCLIIEKQSPHLWAYLLNYLQLKDVDQFLNYFASNSAYLPQLRVWMKQALEELDGIDWVRDNLPKIRAELATLRSQILFDVMSDMNQHRTLRHLDAMYRSAYKNLMEQKRWRKEQPKEDVKLILLPD